jgi:hypothetical protein
MQTTPSPTLYRRQMPMRCLLDRVDGTPTHSKISQERTCCSRHTRGQRISDPSAAPPSNSIRDLSIPKFGVRAPNVNNQCLPVCRCGTGKASAVSASLKLSNRFGEIFAASTRRAEE